MQTHKNRANRETILWARELASINNGTYAARLESLKINPQARPIEEFYLLLDVETVEKAARTHFAQQTGAWEFLRNVLIVSSTLVLFFFVCLVTLLSWSHSPFPFLQAVAIVLLLLAGLGFLAGLLLAFFAERLKHDAHDRAAQMRVWLDGEIYTLAALSLVRSLGPGPADRQPVWSVMVHQAISHLGQALAEVEQLVNASHVTLQSIAQTSQEKLEESLREFRGLIGKQREAVGNFTDGTTELRRAVDRLVRIYTDGEQIYRGLNTTLPRIDQSFHVIAARQDAAATALEAMNGQTHLATKAVGDIAAQFIQTNLVQSTSQAALSLRNATEQLREISEHMREIAVRMGDTVNRQTQLQAHLWQQGNALPSSQFP